MSVVLVAIAAALLAITPAVSAAGRPARTKVTVDAAHPGPRVPSNFVGLSIEAADLHTVAGYAERGNLVTLLRSLGPGLLRVGGNSVDFKTAWSPDGRSRPAWATHVVTARDLDGLARLARETHWRVLLAVTLGHYDPQLAASEVAAARARLRADLAGVEIGNEPDAYARQHLRSEPWDYPQSRSQLDAYRGAISAAAPGVPLAGPDISSPKRLPWLDSFAADEQPALLTPHFYPLTHCNATPTRTDLLSVHVQRKESFTLGRLGALARSHGIRMRLGETNSVSCSGQPRVSNSFAAALWSADYVARIIRAGISGLNLHDLVGYCLGYSPLCARSPSALSSGHLTAQPVWYGLLLARALEGDRPLATHASGARGRSTLFASRTPAGGLHVLIVNPGRAAARLRVHVGRLFAAGSVLRLSAPGLALSSGVTLGGRAVAANGSWHPRRRLPRSTINHGGFDVTVPGGSAALVSLPHR